MELNFRLRPVVKPGRWVGHKRSLPVLRQLGFAHVRLVLHPLVVWTNSGSNRRRRRRLAGMSVFELPSLGQLVRGDEDPLALDLADLEDALERLERRQPDGAVIVDEALKQLTRLFRSALKLKRTN